MGLWNYGTMNGEWYGRVVWCGIGMVFYSLLSKVRSMFLAIFMTDILLAKDIMTILFWKLRI